MKPIAVLGCGPAGMLAAHAVGLSGYPFAIISRPEKSRLGGAQFLHIGIPELTSDAPQTQITIESVGDRDTYKRKVYGPDADVPFVSFPDVSYVQDAWNLIEAYDKLWDIYGSSVTPAEVNPQWLDEHANDFDIIINTIPRQRLCRHRVGKSNQPHHFQAQHVWIHPAALAPLKGDVIHYDGTKDMNYYRMSSIFGVGFTEYSEYGATPPLELIPAIKPISTTCTCFPDIIHCGRHGSWTKGQLTHHAFIEALKLVLPPDEREKVTQGA